VPESSEHLLDARSIMKRFGGIEALHDISLWVDEGEAVGLVGPNGAGKTTLFNCICGHLRADRGEVLFDGRRIDALPVHERARLGIGRTFQRVEVFPEMTVKDHMLVAERARHGGGALWKDLLNMGRPTPDEILNADRVIELLGLRDLGDTPVAALSLGYCRLVELGRALVQEPRLLLADEPSSGLDTRETATLARLLRTVQKEQGTAILLVEHDLEMVARVVDRVVVLDFGHLIAAGPLNEVIMDPTVRRAYLGKTA
jgi:branched-chain amino acid transport system ATP-binding protein